VNHPWGSRTPARPAAIALAIAALLLIGCGGEEREGAAFGFNDRIEVGDPGNELLERSGADFLRTPINWTAVERIRGQRNWDFYDALYEELRELGIEPLWVVTSAPCWASITPCDDPVPSLAPRPEFARDYGDFAAEVAKRYPDSIGIGVWNEPNLERFFRGSPGPELYNELLAATVEEVGERAPEMPVTIAGMSPVTDDEEGKVPWQEYLREVLASDAAAESDGVGLHPYTALVPGDEPRTTVRRIYEETRELAEEAGLGELPLWVTEVGLTTAGPMRISLEEQADGLAEIVTMLEELGAPVIGVHKLFDEQDPTFPADGGYGVVEADRETPKPAFCALATAWDEPCEED
jgi:polysaccharide biosynthesis protein PslG